MLAFVSVSTSGIPGGVFLAVSLGLISVWSLIRMYRTLKGSTLVAPWGWSLIAVASITISETVIWWQQGSGWEAWTGHLRFLAAATTLCPIMAVLGAKRPQNRAWQMIVLSLWGTVALPAVAALSFWPHQALILHPAWQWFLAALIGVGLFNYLPTRFWPSSLLICAAQICLFADHLPVRVFSRDPFVGWIGMACGTVAIVLRAYELPPRREVVEPIDRLWLDFRDSFGALWALRLADRFNDAAKRFDWGVWLTWNGLVRDTPQESMEQSPSLKAMTSIAVSDEVRTAMHKTINGMLRRFLAPPLGSDRNTSN